MRRAPSGPGVLLLTFGDYLMHGQVTREDDE